WLLSLLLSDCLSSCCPLLFVLCFFLGFSLFSFFFFNPPPPTQIYTLSLHDALPIYVLDIPLQVGVEQRCDLLLIERRPRVVPVADRKSTRLNSSHQIISYAVFCLKKKKKKKKQEEIKRT